MLFEQLLKQKYINRWFYDNVIYKPNYLQITNQGMYLLIEGQVFDIPDF